MAESEAVLQSRIVKALRTRGYAPLHIPNEQVGCTAVRIGQLVAMGMMPGAPDLLVPIGEGKTIFMEVKTPRGIQSQQQKNFERLWCQKYGYEYRIVRSVDDALAFLEEKTNGKR